LKLDFEKKKKSQIKEFDGARSFYQLAVSTNAKNNISVY
jgi:hypothetical protein